MNNKPIEKKPKKTFHTANRKGHKLVGVPLIVVGLFWSLQVSGWISPSVEWLSLIWPLSLIGAGLFITFHAGNREKRKNCDSVGLGRNYDSTVSR
jgi:hypothetical protein